MNCNCKWNKIVLADFEEYLLLLLQPLRSVLMSSVYMRVRDCAHACAWDCATAVRTVVVLQEFLLCRGLCLSACNLFITTSPTPAAKCPLCKVLYTYIKAISDISNMPQLQTMQRQSDEFCRVALCVRLQLHCLTEAWLLEPCAERIGHVLNRMV